MQVLQEIQAPFKPDASGVTHNIRNELLEKNRYDTRRLTEIEEPRIDRHQPITVCFQILLLLIFELKNIFLR